LSRKVSSVISGPKCGNVNQFFDEKKIKINKILTIHKGTIACLIPPQGEL
jgi:hypothetical protein